MSRKDKRKFSAFELDVLLRREVKRAKRTQHRIEERMEVADMDDDVDAAGDEEDGYTEGEGARADVAADDEVDEAVDTSDSDDNALNASSTSSTAAATGIQPYFAAASRSVGGAVGRRSPSATIYNKDVYNKRPSECTHMIRTSKRE